MYSRSYRSLTVFAALTAITLGSAAHAQVKPQVNLPTLPSDIKGQIGIGAGDYSFTHFDKTESMKFFTKEIGSRSQHDLKYFKDSVAHINHLFDQILKEDVYGENGLKTYSRNSSMGNGKWTSQSDFLDAVQSFEQHSIELRTAIGKITSIVNAFPSQVAVTMDGKPVTNMPSYGQIKFDDVVNHYIGKLDEITNYLSNLPHQILPSHSKVPVTIQPMSGKGLYPDFQLFQLSPGQMLTKRAEARKLRTWKPWVENGEVFDPMDDFLKPYTLQIKRMVHTFIDTYGKSEKYRYDKHTQVATEAELQNYIDYFYGRSIMRMYYGMPLGAIGVHYKTLEFNLDKLFSDYSVKFYDEVIVDEKDLVVIEKNYLNILNTVNSRTQQVFGKNVNFIDRVNTAFTWIKGANRLAVTNKMMFELLYQDFAEERALTRGDLRGMKKLYDARYKSSPDQIAYYAKLKPKYLNLIGEGGGDDLENDDGFSNGTGTVSGGATVLGSLSKAIPAFQVQRSRNAQAAELEKELMLMDKISEKEVKQSKKRASAL